MAGPALNKLLERGDIDAMMNISSLNLAADAQTDKFRVLFLPNDYWKKKTGYPIVWAASPLVAWKSWVDEDQKRAKNFATAAMESFKWLEQSENLETAVKNDGALAGVTKSEDIAEYKEWLQHKDMFMTDWDRKAVDAQWKFLEVAQQTGVIGKVPPENEYALRNRHEWKCGGDGERLHASDRDCAAGRSREYGKNLSSLEHVCRTIKSAYMALRW